MIHITCLTKAEYRATICMPESASNLPNIHNSQQPVDQQPAMMRSGLQHKSGHCLSSHVSCMLHQYPAQ